MEQTDKADWIAPRVIIEFHRWLKKGDFTQIVHIDESSIISWLAKPMEKGIFLLHQELVYMEAIEETIKRDDFYHLFTPQASSKVIWQKSERLLYYLFHKLSQADLIFPYTQTQLTQKLSQTFIRPNSKRIKARSLSASISDEYHPPRGHEEMDCIIQKLKKLNIS
ncbi:MAG: hypothetical protein AAFU33_20565 [Bacteroidota bacterium]